MFGAIVGVKVGVMVEKKLFRPKIAKINDTCWVRTARNPLIEAPAGMNELAKNALPPLLISIDVAPHLFQPPNRRERTRTHFTCSAK